LPPDGVLVLSAVSRRDVAVSQQGADRVVYSRILARRFTFFWKKTYNMVTHTMNSLQSMSKSQKYSTPRSASNISTPPTRVTSTRITAAGPLNISKLKMKPRTLKPLPSAQEEYWNEMKEMIIINFVRVLVLVLVCIGIWYALSKWLEWKRCLG
jgi:hypothetical protein